MTARRRRALASALGALIASVLCAALSANTHGSRRNVLIVLTFAWLVVAASCVANALRTAPPAGSADVPAAPTTDETSGSDPG